MMSFRRLKALNSSKALSSGRKLKFFVLALTVATKASIKRLSVLGHRWRWGDTQFLTQTHNIPSHQTRLRCSLIELTGTKYNALDVAFVLAVNILRHLAWIQGFQYRFLLRKYWYTGRLLAELFKEWAAIIENLIYIRISNPRRYRNTVSWKDYLERFFSHMVS